MSSATQLPSEPSSSRITARPYTGPVRPVSENDLAPITELYQRVFGSSAPASLGLLKRILFEPPWREESLPSLVYEDASGRIIGCLGVMPRRMKFRGRTIRVAVGHNFMVDASRRGARAGLELARRFLKGPQDLSLAEGNDFSRRIWEFVGGSVCLLYDFCWTRALRPAQHALAYLNHRGLPAAAALALGPICRAIDATLPVVLQRAFRLQPPDALADDLDVVTMLACLSTFTNGWSLQPVYDVSSLAWLINVLDEKRHCGTLYKVAVRTMSGRPLGWYLYYLGASRVAEVLQVGGSEDRIHEVLNHLFYHAWQRGAIAASGPMDPRLCGALSKNHCVFQRPNNSWMLIHSWDERIVKTINAGDAFLTRLEREWWITS